MMSKTAASRVGDMRFASRTSADRDVTERLHKLRVILPAMAQDVAVARREAARLRIENRRLVRALTELESQRDVSKPRSSYNADA